MDRRTTSLYAYDFTVEAKDTYLDLSEFGKGVAFVNGQNLGHFGTSAYPLLYIPHSYLRKVPTASLSLKQKVNIKRDSFNS